VPSVRPRIRRARVALDACLLLGSTLALSWYFLLAPIYLDSQESGLAMLENLSFPVGGLALLFGVSVLWLRSSEYATDRAVVALLFAAIACLVVADFWDAVLLLKTPSYPSGSPPDLFWLAFYLLLLLGGLVRYRLAQLAPASARARLLSQQSTSLQRHDLMAVICYTSPIAAVLLTSAVLLIQAELGVKSLFPSPVPLLIVLCLLVLALVRQALTVAENERLHREREASLREATAQMETFLGIAGHELKSPLASAQLGLQLVERRIRRLLQREKVEVTDVAPLLAPLVEAEHQEERLHRLVNDLVDIARVQAGKLDLHLEPTDLAAIVRQAVEEQRQIHPEHTLVLEGPEEQRVLVTSDAQRLGQVVTN
jgi:signal transduction histidine kinase